MGTRVSASLIPTALTSVWFSRATSEASRAVTVFLDVMFHWPISVKE